MAGLVRFEELVVWRRARRLAAELYQVTAAEPMSRDFGLRDQLRRAGVSVMSNVAEGFESNSTRSFLRFLRIAKASLAEVRCHLYLAVDIESIPTARHTEILAQVEEVGRMLGGLIRSLNRSLKDPPPSKPSL